MQHVSYQALGTPCVNISGYKLLKGDVVCLDTTDVEAEILSVNYSDTTGSRLVAGVVIGDALHNQPVQIAQLGIVDVKVDNSNGAIVIGTPLMLKGGSFVEPSNRGTAIKFSESTETRAIFAVALAEYDLGTTGLIKAKVNATSFNITETSSSGVVGYLADIFFLTQPQLDAKQVILSALPASVDDVVVSVKGAPSQTFGIDFTVSGTVLSWSGYGLDGQLELGDEVTVQFGV